MDADKQPSQDEQPPLLDYAGPGTRKPWWKLNLLEILVVIAIAALALSILLPARSGDLEKRNRVSCSSNLGQVGQACLLYANDHQGSFPDSLAALVKGGRLSVKCLVCPSSADDFATGTTMEELIADLAKPRRCSYIYVGRGLSIGSPKTAVVAYDRLDNHEFDGIKVLYASGRVEWMLRKEAVGFIAELDAGFNPPRPLNQRPATRSATP